MSLLREKQEFRRKEFKKGIDMEDVVKKRQTKVISIRKIKKNKNLSKCRFGEIPLKDQNINDFTEKLRITGIDMRSDDCEKWAKGANTIRKFLCIEKRDKEYMEKIITAIVEEEGVLARLANLVKYSSDVITQIEATWAITNLLTTRNTNVFQFVIETGIMRSLLANILVSKNQDVIAQTLWALGNIAGENHEMADLLIKSGIIDRLIFIVQANRITTLCATRELAFCVSNICNYNDHIPFYILKDLIPIVGKLLQVKDSEILEESLLILSRFTENTKDEDIQTILDILSTIFSENVINLLYVLIESETASEKIKNLALRSVCNIVSGTEHQTQMVLDAGFLPIFYKILRDSKSKKKEKEICWTMSNFTAGTLLQKMEVVKNGFEALMMSKLKTSSKEVKQECIWFFSNLLDPNYEQKKEFRKGCMDRCISLGLISCITEVLDDVTSSPQTLINCMSICRSMLDCGYDILESNGVVDSIGYLIDHENTDVCDIAENIIDMIESDTTFMDIDKE